MKTPIEKTAILQNKNNTTKRAYDRIKSNTIVSFINFIETMKDQSFAQYLTHNWESVLKSRDKCDPVNKPQDQVINKITKTHKAESTIPALGSKKYVNK